MYQPSWRRRFCTHNNESEVKSLSWVPWSLGWCKVKGSESWVNKNEEKHDCGQRWQEFLFWRREDLGHEISEVNLHFLLVLTRQGEVKGHNKCKTIPRDSVLPVGLWFCQEAAEGTPSSRFSSTTVIFFFFGRYDFLMAVVGIGGNWASQKMEERWQNSFLVWRRAVPETGENSQLYLLSHAWYTEHESWWILFFKQSLSWWSKVEESEGLGPKGPGGRF